MKRLRPLLALLASACGGLDPSETPMDEVDAFIAEPPVTPPSGEGSFSVAGRRQRVPSFDGCGLATICSDFSRRSIREEELAPSPDLDLAFSDQALWGVAKDPAGGGVRWYEDLRANFGFRSLLGNERVDTVRFAESFAKDPFVVATVQSGGEDELREIVVTRPNGREGPLRFVPRPGVRQPVEASATRTLDGRTLIAFAEPEGEAIQVLQSDGVATRIPLSTRRCPATPRLLATCGQTLMLALYDDPEREGCLLEAFAWFEDEADWFPTGLSAQLPLPGPGEQGQLAVAVDSEGRVRAAGHTGARLANLVQLQGEGWRGESIAVDRLSGSVFARSVGEALVVAYVGDGDILLSTSMYERSDIGPRLDTGAPIQRISSFALDACGRPAFSFQLEDDPRVFLVRFR